MLASFQESFLPIDTAEALDDNAIDVPKAFHLMAIMMRGAGLGKDDQHTIRIAAKISDSDQLILFSSSNLAFAQSRRPGGHLIGSNHTRSSCPAKKRLYFFPD